MTLRDIDPHLASAVGAALSDETVSKQCNLWLGEAGYQRHSQG